MTTSPEILTVFTNVALLVVISTTALVALVLYYRANRKAGYDEEKHRAELEMLRASVEKDIYRLTDRLVSTEDRWENVNHLLVSRLKSQPETVGLKEFTQINPFLSSYGIDQEDLIPDPKLVFVLMPFNHVFNTPYETISRACRDLDLTCIRGDEQFVMGDLLPHIVRYIVKARIIISIVDGRNPNVFYELGMAHALGKNTILVTKSLEELPFDLRTKKLVVYRSQKDLYDKIQRELARTLVA